MRAEETIAAARGTGCELVDVHYDESGVPHVELACTSGWGAARYLLELARRDVREPAVRELAEGLRRAARGGRDDAAFVRAVHAFVQRTIAFRPEVGEQFQAPLITLARREGDCDCHTRLVYALIAAGGVPARLALLHRGAGPKHVLVQAFTSGRWRWLETTVRGARFDEHPVTAARRAGVLRSDVRGHMREVFMGAIGIEGGRIYRMRVGVHAPVEGAGERVELVVDALRQIGFTHASVQLEPPDDWPPPVRELIADAAWTAWAEAMASDPVCRMIELPLRIELASDARVGAIAVDVDDIFDASTLVHGDGAAVKWSAVTAPNGVKIRSEPVERAGVLAIAWEGSRVVVLGEGFPATKGAPRGWSKVRFGRIEGYASSEWLAPAAGEDDELGELGDRDEPTVRYTGDLSPAFFAKLKAVARRLNIDPEHAMAVMLHESGIRASSIHPTAPAAGLFGLMFRTRDEAVAFTRRTPEEQLDAYEAFMRPYAHLPLHTAEAIYQVNFLPASAIPGNPNYRGSHPLAVLAARDGTGYGGREAGFYRDNTILDFDRDGEITVGDLRLVLERAKAHNAARWNEAVARLAAAQDPGGGIGDVTVAILPWLALGGVVWYLYRS